MTANERRIVFVHSIMCSVYNQLNHAVRLDLFDDDNGDGKTTEEFKEAKRLIFDAYLAAEKAHDALSRLVDKNTDFGGE